MTSSAPWRRPLREWLTPRGWTITAAVVLLFLILAAFKTLGFL